MYAPAAEADPDSDAIREFNQFVIEDARVEAVTLPVRDGITLVRPRDHAGRNSEGPKHAGAAAGMPPGDMSQPRTASARETWCGASGCNTARGNQSAAAASVVAWGSRGVARGGLNAGKGSGHRLMAHRMHSRAVKPLI